jgi:hypothetical protein
MSFPYITPNKRKEDMFHRGSDKPTYTVVQITESDVARSSTLTKSDIGAWCVFASPSNTYHGFFQAKGEANKLAANLRR